MGWPTVARLMIAAIGLGPLHAGSVYFSPLRIDADCSSLLWAIDADPRQMRWPTTAFGVYSIAVAPPVEAVMVEAVFETTDGMEPRERWSFWKDTAMAAVDGIHLGDRSAFSARRSMTDLTSGILIETASSPLSARRPPRKIAQDGDDGVCLMLLTEGHASVDQTGLGESALTAGSCMLFDLAHPYAVAVPTSYRETRLYVPRDVFAARVGRIERLVGLQLRAEVPLARLFNDYVAGVSAALPGMSRRDADAGLDGILHLLTAFLAARADLPHDEGERLSGLSVLDLADRHIAALLSDPAFDPARLARVLGMSRSRLYDAFAGRGGVAAAIRDARLDRVRSHFESPIVDGRSLEQIAFASGFDDYANFSRAFRRRFGMAPSEMRKDARARGKPRRPPPIEPIA